MKKFLKFVLSFVLILGVLFAGYYVYKVDPFSTDRVVTFDVNGGSFVEDKIDFIEVENGSTITLPEVERQGYTFNGWYFGAILWDEYKSVNRDLTLVASWTPIKYKITFIVDGVSHEQLVDFDALPEFSGLVEKEPTNTITYTFSGWNPEIKTVDGDATYTAVFTESERKYKVEVLSSLENAGVVSGGGEFSYLDDTVISVVANQGYTFEGWYLDGSLYSSGTSITLNDIKKDYKFIARWAGDNKTIRFSVDGLSLSEDSISTSFGETITEPNINTTKYGMSGYKIVGWYTDPELTNKYTFGDAPLTDITLYGKWDYILNNGFYDYLSKFQGAQTNTRLTINSMDELIAWVEYVQFYNITTKYPLTLNFSYSGILNRLEYARSQSRYPSNVYEYVLYESGTNAHYYICSSYRDKELSLLDADPTDSYVAKQLDFAYALGEQTGRIDTFDSFNISKVVQTITVITSNQLVYALEVGLEPICVAGSPAESVLNSAKQVLRDICTDEMDEITKLRAIYEWLVLNVEYDNRAADLAIAKQINWQEYDAWYAEGVFNQGKAVCDGIAKAFLILAKIENIPIIRVGGDSHAWNKVYINGKWYGVDATHGGCILVDDWGNPEYEILTYSNFLFTDSFKADGNEDGVPDNEGYVADDYVDIDATTVFNIYDYLSFSNGSSEFDWFIDSEQEYVLVLQYVQSVLQSSTANYCCVEIVINPTSGLTINKLNNHASYYGLAVDSCVEFFSSMGYSVYGLMFA